MSAAGVGAGAAVGTGRRARRTRTHRALVRTRHGVEVRDVATPAPGPGEVLLAPEVVGVCGTDLQILRGLREDPTSVLGHEGTARVVAVGPDVAPGPGTRVGQRVMVNPTHPHDDSFLLGHNLPGLWAERVLVPAVAVGAGLVLPVLDRGPESEPSSLVVVAALAEPLAAVTYGHRVTLAAAGRCPAALVVWGDGVVGHLAVRWWRDRHPGLRVLHVHHTAAGLTFGAAQRQADLAGERALRFDDLAVPGELAGLSALTGPVAAVLATPRNATATALHTLVEHCRGALSVNVHGGIPATPLALDVRSDPDDPAGLGTGVGAGLRTRFASGVDVAGIRARNRAGLPLAPASQTFARTGAGSLTVCGQRGVDDTTLLAAVALLDAAPRDWADLVTHEVGLEEAADLLTSLGEGARTWSGRRVLKAAIRVAL